MLACWACLLERVPSARLSLQGDGFEPGTDIHDMVNEGQGLRSQRTVRGNVYLARYEQLESAFARLLELESLPARRLRWVNEAHKKPLSEEVSAAFQTEPALALKARTRSEITEALGYC